MLDTETFPLDDALIEKIAQADVQIRDINMGVQGMLSYFLALHKLTGNWRLAENRKELIRNPDPAMAPAAPERNGA